MRPELLEGLTPEQIAKVKSCNDPKELLKLIEEEDVCLNEAQLAAVSGGGCGGGGSIECPDCHSTEFKELSPQKRQRHRHLLLSLQKVRQSLVRDLID